MHVLSGREPLLPEAYQARDRAELRVPITEPVNAMSIKNIIVVQTAVLIAHTIHNVTLLSIYSNA